MASLAERIKAATIAENGGSLSERVARATEASSAVANEPRTVTERANRDFGFDDLAYRGSILPLGRTKEGKTELATPGVIKDMMTSAMLPGHVAQGGDFSAQDVAKFTLDYGVPASQRTRMVSGSKVNPTQKQFVNRAKTGEQLREQATEAYTKARQAGVVVGDQSYDNFITNAELGLRGEGYREKLYPQIKNILESWRGDREPQIDFTELDIYRKQLTDLRRSNDKSAQRLGEILTSKLDDYVDNLDPSDLTGGTADEAGSAAKALNQARSAYTRAKKVETIEDMIYNANQAKSGFENGIVDEMRRITKKGSPSASKRIASFSPEERKLMEEISQQPTTQKILRFLGKMSAVRSDAGNLSGAMLGGGMGSYIGGSLAGTPGAVVGGMAAPAVGYAAQKAAIARATGRVDLLKAAAAQGKAPPTLPPEQLLKYQMMARSLGPLLGEQQGSNGPDPESKKARLKRDAEWLAKGGI